MERADQTLRHRLLGIRYHLCCVPSIQTGEKRDYELCTYYLNWFYGHCNGGLVCSGSQEV